MLSVLSHIEVIGAAPLTDWQKTAAEALRNKEVVGAAPYVAAQAMLTRDDVVRGVLLRGVDPAEEPKVSDIASQFRAAA
jgi:lipoprotein-releasing system permease protein